jgi:PAS domain S-box-containing protein
MFNPTRAPAGFARHDHVLPYFEYIFAAIPEAVVFASLEGRIQLANLACQNLLGFTEQELIGQKVELFYGDRQDFGPRDIIRYGLGAEGEVKPSEADYRKKSGKIFPAETTWTVVRDRVGQSLGFLGLIRDITDCQESERSRHAQRVRLGKKVEKISKELLLVRGEFRKYIDIAAVMLVALNQKGEITFINQEGCKLLQVNEEDVFGLNWFDHLISFPIGKYPGIPRNCSVLFP